MDHKFKVGQKVRIVKEEPTEYVAGGFTSDMRAMLGREVTIKRTSTHTAFERERNCYTLEEDIHRFIWDERLFEDVKGNVLVLNGWEELAKTVPEFSQLTFRLPYGVHYKKVIQNGNCVIVIFADLNNKQYKMVAKCHEDDVFDLRKGIEICLYKMYRKVANMNLKRLNK